MRGSARTQHHRPGARASTPRAPGTRPARTTARDDTRPASELEVAPALAEEIIERRPAAADAELERVARTSHTRHKIKAGSLLAARAATEYVYVASDIKKIVLVAATLFVTLILLWVLIVVLRVIPLPFY